MIPATPNKWADPPVLLTMVQIVLFGMTILWALFGQLGAPNQIKEMKAEFGARMDQSDKRMSEGFDKTQAQISMIPAVGARLGAVEQKLLENGARDFARDTQLADMKQGVANDHANLMTTMRDVAILQDAANGRLPGARGR